MPSSCVAAGLWDVIHSAPYMSKQQWQATNLLILCEILVNNGIVPDMSSCTVQGLWNQIQGSPPFLSDQEFYAENINLLCQLLGVFTGGGGTTVITKIIHSAPDEPGGTIPILAFQFECNLFWYWDPTSGTWTPLKQDITVPTIVELRQIVTVGTDPITGLPSLTEGCPPLMLFTQGNLVVGDDQPAAYRWDPDRILDPDDGTPDNGMKTIKPDDRADTDPGRYVQVVFA